METEARSQAPELPNEESFRSEFSTAFKAWQAAWVNERMGPLKLKNKLAREGMSNQGEAEQQVEEEAGKRLVDLCVDHILAGMEAGEPKKTIEQVHSAMAFSFTGGQFSDRNDLLKDIFVATLEKQLQNRTSL